MEKRLLKYSPLTEATYYILLTLNNPLHGYGIIKRIDALTKGRLIIPSGTLYGAINTLINNKLIELISIDPKSKGKKMYIITTSGKKLIYYEINRLKEMVNNGIGEVGDYYE